MNILISNDDGIRAEGIARAGRGGAAVRQGLRRRAAEPVQRHVAEADHPRHSCSGAGGFPRPGGGRMGQSAAPRADCVKALSRPSSPAGRTWC